MKKYIPPRDILPCESVVPLQDFQLSTSHRIVNKNTIYILTLFYIYIKNFKF